MVYVQLNKFRVAAVVCIIFLSSSVLIPFACADWTMFRSDPSHSGKSTSNSVLTPTVLWNYTIPPANPNIEEGHAAPLPATMSSPAVVDGVVYMGSQGGSFYAVNASNGSLLWNYTAVWSVYGTQSSPAVVNGTVYIGSDDHNVYALNATNGAKLWNFTTSYIVDSSPTVIQGVVYIGSAEGVYALNADNGAKIWNYTTSGWIESSPAVANGVLYVGSDDDSVYALNATNGAEIWNYPMPNGNIQNGAPVNEVQSSPSVVNGVVYVGAGDGNVYALNADNGKKNLELHHRKLWRQYWQHGCFIASCCQRCSLRRLL